jgi:hypothetical protein
VWLIDHIPTRDIVDGGESSEQNIRNTDDQWEVLNSCWDANPKYRPTFDELIENPDWLKLPNCHNREFNDYLEIVLPALRNP